ncbi:hypothetical protein PVA45_04560 [Entomospira entomophila]|uniref:DUF1574 domain-containing protein n=1 Tax=Entomospira entomophila TaxID=2719988 RepID=A0A968GA83_9SPIO|nr:hypothetical protein [Entomospira entomophilus]NIZ40777.1 hypothetical protein [Entomospira entomophilus]WDI34990.1 hypothetical protein PVA45_04560 [Entomospira entomophilus]
MFISSKKWLKIFFIITIFFTLLVPIYNYLIDYNAIFDHKFSQSYRAVSQGAQLLTKGISIQRPPYNRNQFFLLTDLYSSTQTPEILILGTSRTFTISQNDFHEETPRILNASINGGNFPGIVATWQSFKKTHQTEDLIVIVEISPDAHKHAFAVEFGSFNPRVDALVKEFTAEYPELTFTPVNQILKKNHLFSLDYFLKNILAEWTNAFTPATSDVYGIIKPDGSNRYPQFTMDIINAEKQKNADLLTEKFQKVGQMQGDHMSPFLSIITEDIIASGATPIFLLPPYHPSTYDDTLEKSNILVFTENWVREFAEQHDIMVLGSYNPHMFHLTDEFFLDGNHTFENAWGKILNTYRISK